MQAEPTRPPEPTFKIDALYQVRGPLADNTLYNIQADAEEVAYNLWEKSGMDHYVHMIRTPEGKHT